MADESCEPGSGDRPALEVSVTASATRAVSPVARWEPLTSIPTPRIAYAAASLGGRVHVVGGLRAAGQFHEAYDPESDSWVRLLDLLVRVDHGWAASVQGRMYVGDGGSTRIFCYDPEHRAWVEVSASPYRHGNTPAVGVIKDQIYVAGGVGEGWSPVREAAGETSGKELSRCDPATDTWMVLTPMTCGRHHTVGAVIKGGLHVVGGRPGRQVCHEAYDPDRDEWDRLADLPTGREGMAGAAIGGWFFVGGGEGNPDAPYALFDAVEAYDPEADEWVALAPMPSPRHGSFAATIGDSMFLPGGGRMLSAMASNDVLVLER